MLRPLLTLSVPLQPLRSPSLRPPCDVLRLSVARNLEAGTDYVPGPSRFANTRPGADVIRFRMFAAYDGLLFQGYQWQPESRTVQDELEKGVSRIFKARIRVPGASRTDQGVHARGQVVMWDVQRATLNAAGLAPGKLLMASGPQEDNRRFADELHRLSFRLNAILPDDCKVRQVELAPPEFNCHKTASKLYIYRWCVDPCPDPLSLKNSAWTLPVHCRVLRGGMEDPREMDMDMAPVREAAALLQGRHDFRLFMGKKRSNTPGNRKAKTEKWVRELQQRRLGFEQVGAAEDSSEPMSDEGEDDVDLEAEAGGGGRAEEAWGAASGGQSAKAPKSTVRTIYRCEAFLEDGIFRIEMEGSGFLYGMARKIARILLEVGSRRMDVATFCRLLDPPAGDETVQQRQLAELSDELGTAPAEGLTLARINYR